MSAFLCGCVCHMCVGAYNSQRRVLDPLNQELKATVSHQIWVIETIFQPLSHISIPKYLCMLNFSGKYSL